MKGNTMEQARRQQLERLGVNVEETLGRFMDNEELLLKYLRKLKEDPTMEHLQRALERGEAREAFRCAHTLKGMAATLGLSHLQKEAEKLTDLLRGMSDGEEIPSFAGRRVQEEMDAILRFTETL